MMHLSSSGFEFLKSFEGFEAQAYRCPGGYQTIGYGHVIRKGEDYASALSLFEAERLLRQDATIAENAVRRFIDVNLRQKQFDALVSFTFNLGSGALQRSTLRRKINREEHDEVPDELMKWIWAAGRRLPGLIRRRQAEGVLYQG